MATGLSCSDDRGERAKPVDGARRAELGGAEPLDEVAAPAAAGVLERRQHAVDGGEPARDPLAGDRAPGDDAVPVEQPLRGRVGATGRVGVDRGEKRPAAGRLRGTGPGDPAGSRGRLPAAVGRAAAAGERSERGEGVVAGLTHQIENVGGGGRGNVPLLLVG